MDEEKRADDYWTQVDYSFENGWTYEHRMPHGVLVKVTRLNGVLGCQDTMYFVPDQVR